MHLIDCDRIKKDLFDEGLSYFDGELLKSNGSTSQQSYVITLVMKQFVLYICLLLTN